MENPLSPRINHAEQESHIPVVAAMVVAVVVVVVVEVSVVVPVVVAELAVSLIDVAAIKKFILP